MNRLAVFVEGYTEVVFVERLVEEIAGQDKVLIEHREIRGGATVRRTFAQVRAARPDTGQKYYILIVDCGGDHQVKSRILEEHEGLTKAGYQAILGLRDVRPDFTRDEIPRLERGLPYGIKTKLCPVEILLAVMEVEAWFLAEATHLFRIDPAITAEAVKAALGFDPSADDMEQRDAPATDLAACYALGGKAYSKGAAKDTVDALDFAEMYLARSGRVPRLKRLIDRIEAFLAT
ncbi:MAG: hypothetical protein K2W96_26805 [Gemmataceae bacterium]|nr:hypothetical protein [Gemmataceae bacterium]